MLSKIIILAVVVVSIHAAIDQNFQKQNDVSSFNCKDKPRISRFPDKKDCSKFIYCVSGTPHSAKCWPEGARFNPVSTRCDLPPTASCGPISTTTRPHPSLLPIPVQIRPNVPVQVDVTPIISTTPTTTTVAPTTPKPEHLMDMFSFDLDCGRTHSCGLYPNHKGDCSTFFLCTENGDPITKRCHGGQNFDTVTQECRPPEEATCWKKPDNGPHSLSLPPTLCSPHGYNSSLEEDVILATPPITNWGDWQPAQSCPAGSYISGINAWRRVLQAGSRIDQGGLVSIGVQCRNPDGGVTKVLESVAPGAKNDGFVSFYSCGSGVGVGFNANIQPPQGPGVDNLATDNVQLACSCGPVAYKPYENIPGIQGGYRGVWTGFQSCRIREALCGIQTQMATYREVAGYDNTGLNNLRMRCCPVPDPVDSCVPKEKLIPIRTCVNDDGIYPRRCNFSYTLGMGYDTKEPTQLQSINFHQSVGHVLGVNEMDAIKQKFYQAASAVNGTGCINQEYTWEQSDPMVWNLDQFDVQEKALYLPVNTLEQLFQVVGTCGHFIVRTPRFLRVRTEQSSGNKTRVYFDV